MNPLFLEKSNFLVSDGDGEVLGAGQIRPLGSFFELASLVVREHPTWGAPVSKVKLGLGGVLPCNPRRVMTRVPN